MAKKRRRDRKREATTDRGGSRRGAARPTSPQTITAARLVTSLLDLLKAVGARAALAVILVELPLVVITLVGDPTGMIAVFYGLVAIVGSAAAIHIALEHVGGRPSPSMPRALRVGVSSWLGLLAAGIFAGLIVLFFGLLLIVPGVLRALSYAMISPLVVSGECYGVDALEESRRRMRGHRLQALWAYVAVFLPMILWQGLYLAIFGAQRAFGTGAELPPLSTAERTLDAFFNVLYPLFDLPVTLLAVVLYSEVPRPAADRT